MTDCVKAELKGNVNSYGAWWRDTIPQNILKKKYFHEEELKVAETDFDKAFLMFVERVAGIFPKDKDKIGEFVAESIVDGTFLPAGRTLYGAGAKGKFKASLSNCYILPSPEDNIESIFDTAKEMARIYSFGGGCGTCISKLRPKDAIVHNSAKTSSGAVSFMDVFNIVGEVIGNNGRRSALLIALDCTHPDIEEFLTIKQNNDKIQGANISIKFTDEFMKAVKRGEDVTLRFDNEEAGVHVERKINATEFFHKFAEAQREWCEPGALFIDMVQNWNLLSGYPKEDYNIEVTNPCVTGDTLILTKQGYQPIRELAGKEVEVWNGYEWSKVEPKVTGHNQKTLKITFSNGAMVQCTPYHKWVLKNGNRVEAQNLKVGDALQKYFFPVIQGNCGFKKVGAYTLGFYSGDGTKNLRQIVLYGEKQKLIDKLDVHHYVEYPELNKTVVTLTHDYEKFLVPPELSTLDTKLNFLAGLADADGCVNSQDGALAISSVNPKFLDKVRLMLNSLGVSSYVSLMHKAGKRNLPKNDGSGEYKLYDCQPCYRLTISSYYVQRLIELGFETHRLYFNCKPNRNASRFITVASIEEAEIADSVYCMNEPKNHTFIANGVLTGNCAEFASNAYNSCNLGSINLYNFVKNPFTKEAEFDFHSFCRTVSKAVIAMDMILDYGYDMQPLDANRKCIDDWRSIGLGVFGLADMLVAMGLKYGETEAIRLIREIMYQMQQMAYITSARRGHEKGNFGKFDPKKFYASDMVDDIRTGLTAQVDSDTYGAMRNGTLLAIAPTGSISMLFRESGGVEPYYNVAYERTTHVLEKQGKSFHIAMLGVEHLLKSKGIEPGSLSNDEIKAKFPFVVDTYDITPEKRVDLQATMQGYVDNAISSTINLKESTTEQEIFDLYVYAWEHGCKGITIFRDNCKRINIMGTDHGVKRADIKQGEQAPKITVIEKPVTEQEMQERRLDYLEPVKRGDKIKSLWGRTFVYHTACVKKFYVTVNVKDNDIFEVFVGADTGCQANISTITRLTSYALRLGGKALDIADELDHATCPACMHLRKTGDKTINRSCASCIASAIKEMYATLKGGKSVADEAKLVNEMPPNKGTEKPVETSQHTGMAECPECHQKTLVPDGHCVSCPNCGYTKCS